jgi:hypothetical protein
LYPEPYFDGKSLSKEHEEIKRDGFEPDTILQAQPDLPVYGLNIAMGCIFRHTGPARIRPLQPNDVSINKIRKSRIIAQDQGNGYQLLGYLAPRHNVKYTALGISLIAHFPHLEMTLCKLHQHVTEAQGVNTCTGYKGKYANYQAIQ